MRLLVDLDDVTFNWGARFDAALNARQAAAHRRGDVNTVLAIGGIPRSHEHAQWDLFAGLEPEQRLIVRSILDEPGFYAELEPIAGSIEALWEMDAAGHDVRIVTSPMSTNPTCADDKLASVERHLGRGWRKRVVITDDKTIVHGDVLFDDKGCITGSMEPSWTQVLIHQRHNESATHLLRITNLWMWESALEALR